MAYVIAWHVADELHVLNVATREDRRRRGIARQLMDQLVELRARRSREARAARGAAIERSPRSRSIARWASSRWAFAARYYPDDEDAIEMVLAFDTETGEIVPHADEVRLHG